MAAFWEERQLPESPKRLQHLEGFDRCKCGVWAVLPTPLGIPPLHREIPLHPGARTRRAVLGERTIGVGRNSRGDGRGAEHPPRSLLAFGRDARLRRGRREVRKLPISGPESPGSATCSQESYLPRENYVIRGNASQRAMGPVPAAAHRGTSGRSLAAPPGTAWTIPPSRPSLNREIGWVFFF